MPKAVLAFRVASAIARSVPTALSYPAATAAGAIAARLMPTQADQVRRNLARIDASNGVDAGATVPARLVRQSFAAYARYWLESFRLAGVSPQAIDDGHDVVGYEHIATSLAAGRGVILALPHLGGWEWAGFWLTRVQGLTVTVVVEALEPPELFEWFVRFRQELGMHVVALGPDAAREVLAALRRNEVVCLLADRDLARNGIEVEFFGERTTLPAGPAALGIRANAPVLPVGVYFRRGGVRSVVMAPLDMSRRGSLRADIARVTQEMAFAFESLIGAAPQQWHLLQPNWPSDPGYHGDGVPSRPTF